MGGPQGLDCTKNVALEFGDTVEIPEREHSLAEMPVGLSDAQNNAIKECLKRQVKFRINARPIEPGGPNPFSTIEVTLSGLESETYLSRALKLDTIQKFLRSSSDFSRVRILRTDGATGKAVELTQDVEQIWNNTRALADDLWLRDGDIVEVPEKP
jgi:hypothetical protein